MASVENGSRAASESHSARDKNLSYVGIRDISQVDKIDEEDIVGANGELRGIKNRVRAGLANFEDVGALERVSIIHVVTSCNGEITAKHS